MKFPRPKEVLVDSEVQELSNFFELKSRTLIKNIKRNMSFKTSDIVSSDYFVKYLFIALIIITMGACISKKESIQSNISDSDSQFYYTFLEANRLKILGDYKNSLELFAQCLKLKPTSDASMHEIARISASINNYDVAIKYAKLAVKQNPDNKYYYFTLADIYLDNRMYDEAVNVYENIRKVDPNNHEATYYLAMLYKQTNKLNDALNVLNELESSIGINESVSINKQQIYLLQGNKSKAYDEINKLINYSPNEPKYISLIGEMYTRDNLFLKAEEAFNKLFSIDSLNPEGQLSIVDFYRRKMDYDNAFLTVNKIIDNDQIEFGAKVMVLYSFLNTPKEFSIYVDQIEKCLIRFKDKYTENLEGYTLYSDFLIKKNNYEEASNQLETAVSNFDTNEIIWEQLISLYSFLGKYNKMYEKSTSAIDSFPENPSFYLYKGLSAIQLKEEEIAVKALSDGLELVNNNRELEINFYIYLGEAYQAIKNYIQSEYYFEKALEMKPDDIYVLNNYSYYLSLRDEKLEYAEKLSKRTINTEPDNSTYLDTYAWILYKLERYADALFYIRKAYDYGGFQNKVIVEHYGDILLKENNIQEAVRMWKLSLKLGNSDSELINKIEKYSPVVNE